MTSLLELRVQGNKLTALPEQLGACKRLRSLNAGKNELTDMPGTLLQSLSCLRELHLCVPTHRRVRTRGSTHKLSRPRYQNKLTAVAPEIMYLPELRHLTLSKCVGGTRALTDRACLTPDVVACAATTSRACRMKPARS